MPANRDTHAPTECMQRPRPKRSSRLQKQLSCNLIGNGGSRVRPSRGKTIRKASTSKFREAEPENITNEGKTSRKKPISLGKSNNSGKFIRRRRRSSSSKIVKTSRTRKAKSVPRNMPISRSIHSRNTGKEHTTSCRSGRSYKTVKQEKELSCKSEEKANEFNVASRPKRERKPAPRFSFDGDEPQHLTTNSAKKRQRRENPFSHVPGHPEYDLVSHIKSVNPLWKRIGVPIDRELRKVRYSQQYIDAFEWEGYSKAGNQIKFSNSGNKEQKIIKPEEEIKKHRDNIFQSKKEIKNLMGDLWSGHERLVQRLNVERASEFVCCVCEGSDSFPGNEIILCDLKACNLGCHQKCCSPVVEQKEFENIEQENEPGELDPWFCRRCTLYLHLLNVICEEFQIDVETHKELFLEECGTKKESADVKNILRSPADILSTSSEAEQESFEINGKVEKTDDVQSIDSVVDKQSICSHETSTSESSAKSPVQETVVVGEQRPRRARKSKVDYSLLMEEMRKNGELLPDEESDSDFVP